MTVEQTFLGHHREAVLQADPAIECPIRLARSVLDRLGVDMRPHELTEFAEDLAHAERSRTMNASDPTTMRVTRYPENQGGHDE